MSRVQNRKFSAAEWWVFQATMKEADGSVINITAAQSIRWSISNAQGEPALVEATLDNGRVAIVSGAGGRADITVQTADHSEIVPGTYWHQCVIKLASGRESAQWHGDFTVEAATP